MLKWEVIDYVSHNTDLPIKQIWNPHPDFIGNMKIAAKDDNNILTANIYDGWYSSYYGKKEHAQQHIFSTSKKTITTEIMIDL